MIEQTALHNILTWVIAVILFIFQSLNYFVARIKKYAKHGQKKTTVVTTDTTTLSELNPNNNNAPKNVIAVQGLIQKHFDIPLIIAEDEPKVNDFIKSAQLLISNDNFKEKQKIDQFMEHFVDDSYVARGLGLITANVGRESEFYLYSKYDNNFENVVIRLKGRHGESGQIIISGQDPTNLIETKSIPIDYFYDEDRIKVTYTPFAEGVYTLTLVRNGLSICRSPYYISVEKSPTNSRSQIRLGTKKYKMVSKFAKAKHVPLETCDSNIPVIEPSKPSISRNILPASEENSIRTDVMSIVTKFESNSIHFQKKIHKHTSNISKTSPKTSLIDEISINSNIQPKIVTGNDHDTNVNDLNSASINSIPKSAEEKFWSNIDISNINSKKNDINSIDAKSNLMKKSIIKLDKCTRNTNDIPRVKNVSLNHLEPTNSVLLKESLNYENSHDVEKQNKTYDTNELIHGQNQIETFLDPITIIDKSEIKCIDNELFTQNEVSCFDGDNKKTVVVMENINELESHPKDSAIQQISDSAQYNINTLLASIITKITNCVCEKCSKQVLKILSEIPRDINLTYKNNSNEICSSLETLLAQPISIDINIDNLFENPTKPANEQKNDNLLTKSSTNMKLMDTIDKDVKYHYLNEITQIDNTSNGVYCDINNTTKELIIKKNKLDGEINTTKNDKLTDNFSIPFTEHDIDKRKTVQLENKLSTNEIIKNEYSITNEANVLNSHQLNNANIYKSDDKMQMQIQDVQISLEHNMDLIETHQFHEYNKKLNNINKENDKTLDKSDLVTTSYEKKINTEPLKEEFKIKNDIIPEKNTNSQSSPINSTVLASMEVELPTLKYKSEDNQQDISNISNINVILTENQKLIIENSIEPVLNNFKNKIVEKITQLYLNKNISNTENTSINENDDIQETHSLQETKLYNNDDNKDTKTKYIETLKSQLKNHIDKNEISKIILDKTKMDNNHLSQYVKNIIKTNMNSSEMHSEKLGENNPQTLVNIAINHINNQQTDSKFKMMIIENETPNFKVKKNNNEDTVQDTEIMLTKTPSDIKIETIKPNISEKTDEVQKINDKNKDESIKLQIKENELRKITNIVEKETINGNAENNNNMGTTISSTKNTATNQKKKKESELQEIKKITEAIDIDVEKENDNKLSQLNRTKDIIVENLNSEVRVSNANMVKQITEKEISSESTSYNNAKKLNIKRTNTEKKENTNETLGNNNESVKILSNYQLTNDISHTVKEEFKKEKDASQKSLNTKYRLKTLESTVNEMNCNIPENENKIPTNTSPAEIVKLYKDKANEPSAKNDTIHETEIMPDTIIHGSDIDYSSLNKSSMTPLVKKIVVEFVTKKNTTTIDSLAIIVHEQIEHNDETTKDTKIQTNSWTVIKEKEVTRKNKTTKSNPCTNNPNINIVEQLDVDNVNGENTLNLTTEPDITNKNNDIKNERDHPIDISNTFVEEKIEREEININPLSVVTPVTSIVESNIADDINETELISCTDIPNVNIIESMVVGEVIEEHLPTIGTETGIVINNDINETETSLPTDTSSTSGEATKEVQEIFKTPLEIESPVISEVESNVVEVITVSELQPCTDTFNVNIAEPIVVDEVIDEHLPTIDTETVKLINNNINETETSLPTKTSSTSGEATKEVQEIFKTPLEIESPVISEVESNIADDINETELISCTDIPNVNIIEPMVVGEVIEEHLPTIGTETGIVINNDINETETSLPTDTSSTSEEATKEVQEIFKTPLEIESPVISEVESNVVEVITEIELSPCTDTFNVNIVEPMVVDEVIDEHLPTIDTETVKLINNNINETETSLPTDTSSTSGEATKEVQKIFKTPLEIESPVISEVESNIADDINETELISCTDIPNVNIIEPMVVGEVIEEHLPTIGTETGIVINNDINETETSLPTDISSTSEEATKEVQEIFKTPLEIESPVISEVESNVVEVITEIELSPCTDTFNVNIVEPMVVDEVIDEHLPTIDTETVKLINNNINETEASLPTDTSSTSGEATKEVQEIFKTPLEIESPVISEVESNIVENITEIELQPCTDIPNVNIIEPMVVGEVLEANIPNIETEMGKLINNDINETETSLPTKTSSTSGEATKEVQEIFKTPLEIESPVISEVESTVVEVITGSELQPCTDIPNVNIIEPMVVGEVLEANIPNIETEMGKLINNDINETETSLPTDTSSTSEEATKEVQEIFKTPLEIESPVISEVESNVADDINETELISCTDIPNVNIIKPMVVGEVIEEHLPTIETETGKVINNDIKETETSLPTDTSSTSGEATKEVQEIFKAALEIESPITSSVESKVVEVITESELSPCTDTFNVNIVEPMVVDAVIEEHLPTIETETGKVINNDIKEIEASLPTDTSSTSGEATKEVQEIFKTPLEIESPVISEVESNILENITEIELQPCTDIPNVNIIEPMVVGEVLEANIPNIETEMGKLINNDINETETSLPTKTSSTSGEATKEVQEIFKTPLEIESPVISEVESTVVEVITGSELQPCTDIPNVNIIEPMVVGEVLEANIPNIETEMGKLINNDINETETSLPTDTSSTSEEATKEVQEIFKTPLEIESPVISEVESNVADDINETELISCTDIPNVNIIKPMVVGEVIEEHLPTIETETGKVINNDIKETETSLPTDTSSTSGEATKEVQEIFKAALEIESPITSSVESKVVEVITESELSPCTDTFNVNIVEPMVVDAVIEEHLPTIETETGKVINNDIKEIEASLPTDTSSTSGEATKEVQEIFKTPLEIESPVISEVESNIVENITEIELQPCTDIPNVNIIEPMVVGEVLEANIPNIETEMGKLINNDINETETSLPTKTSSTSGEATKEVQEIFKTPLEIESPVISEVESTVVEVITGSELQPCTDIPNVNIIEPMVVGEVLEANIPNIETEMGKLINNDINETETSLPTDTSSTSEEATKEVQEIFKTPLEIESPVISEVESNVADDINETELISCTDIPNVNIIKPMVVGEVIEEHLPTIETETGKVINNDIKETETSLPTDTSSTSGEATKEVQEIFKAALEIESPITSSVESKVVEVITESELSPCTDTFNVNIVEPMVVDAVIEANIPNIETETGKLIINDIIETESSLPTDTSSTSVEATNDVQEIIKTPLQNESPVILVQPMVVDEVIEANIPSIETETGKVINNDINETETSLPTDTSSTSGEATKEVQEIIKTPLQIEFPVISEVESNVVEVITESELQPDTDIPNVNIIEPMVVGEVLEANIPSIETETGKVINNDINETETSLPTVTSSTSGEATKEVQEIIKTPLQNESPVISEVESTVVEVITGSELQPCIDIQNVNIIEPMVVGGVIEEHLPTIGIETGIMINNDINETKTSLPTDTSSTSGEATKEVQEIFKGALEIESPITSSVESKVVEVITEIELQPCTDTFNVNIVEPIVVDEVIEEHLPTIDTETVKLINNDINETETSLPTDTSSTSVEATKEVQEIFKAALEIESPITSSVESKVVEVITETELSPCTDTFNVNIVEPMVVDEVIEANIPNIETETRKLIINDIIETETSLPTDTSSTSGEATKEVQEIFKAALEIESPITSSVKSKVVEVITETELSPCTDIPNVNIGEPIVLDDVIEAHIPNIETETEKVINNVINETETSLPTDRSSTSEEEIIKTHLQIESPGITVESKVVEVITGTDLITYTDISNLSLVDNMDAGNFPNTAVIELDINVKEYETVHSIYTPSTFVEGNIDVEEIIKDPLSIDTSGISIAISNAIEDKTETELSPCADSLIEKILEPIVLEEVFEVNNQNSSIMTVKLISNNDKESETYQPICTSSTSVDEMNNVEETILTLDTSVEQSTLVNEEKLNFADILHSKHIAHIQSTKIFLKDQTIIDFEIENKSLLPNDAFPESVEKHDLDKVVRETVRVNVKEIKNTIGIDTPTTFVEDQKVESHGTVIENILAIDTSTASVQEQIQIEEVIKDESVSLINFAVSSDEQYAVEHNEIKITAMVSSITSMEEHIIVNAEDVMDTFTESLDKTAVENGTHDEISTLTDILSAVTDEQIDLEKVTNSETQILVDTSIAFSENPIKIEECTETEITALFTCASTSEVESNEIDVNSGNKTSTPINLASVAIEQTESDTVIEMTSPNINVINSNSETIFIDKEIKTKNSDNPKNCYLKFGESSKFHCLKNEDNSQGQSYGIQKLEMSVQRLKTSNDDYYEKTFVQLEQTEKISSVDKDKVDCENINNIDDKLYTVNESDLNAILCASSLEEALTLLDSKIKFKFKHRKSSSKANSASSFIPEIQTSESKSSGTNTNFTDARDFFKEIEKKSKK
ncbi:uncharacterized protein LOC132930725 [Rhopalosiphum padi]|uniref:uncharacterized protein LOC132930725 n=1 Tax=Rhopalosiphum padi TaxID=40932 RepID=UPI00298E30F4|nr:uncharacterized protein LOC132930725 [Rhopalosiphum padi]